MSGWLWVPLGLAGLQESSSTTAIGMMGFAACHVGLVCALNAASTEMIEPAFSLPGCVWWGLLRGPCIARSLHWVHRLPSVALSLRTITCCILRRGLQEAK